MVVGRNNPPPPARRDHPQEQRRTIGLMAAWAKLKAVAARNVALSIWACRAFNRL